MIYTVTFNPALDYVVRMDELALGQVNRTVSEDVQLGGKGINVSWVLRELGHENVALGFVAGFTGKAIEDGLAGKGVATDFIHVPGGAVSQAGCPERGRCAGSGRQHPRQHAQ